MALDVDTLHTQIRNVLDGVFDGVRDIAANTYQVGSPDAAAGHALSLSLPTYEINIVGIERSAASPMSTTAAHSIEVLNLDIEFVYALPSVVESTDRYATQATMIENANLAVQALTYQGNLNNASFNGIVSGMLFGPGGTGYPSVDHDRDWATLIGRTTIHASAVMHITQLTS